jgi:hypothetical protein
MAHDDILFEYRTQHIVNTQSAKPRAGTDLLTLVTTVSVGIIRQESFTVRESTFHLEDLLAYTGILRAPMAPPDINLQAHPGSTAARNLVLIKELNFCNSVHARPADVIAPELAASIAELRAEAGSSKSIHSALRR